MVGPGCKQRALEKKNMMDPSHIDGYKQPVATVLQALATNAVIYVPCLQAIFATTALSLAELGIALAASTLVWIVVEVWKVVVRRRFSTTTIDFKTQ